MWRAVRGRTAPPAPATGFSPRQRPGRPRPCFLPQAPPCFALALLQYTFTVTPLDGGSPLTFTSSSLDNVAFTGLQPATQVSRLAGWLPGCQAASDMSPEEGWLWSASYGCYAALQKWGGAWAGRVLANQQHPGAYTPSPVLCLSTKQPLLRPAPSFAKTAANCHSPGLRACHLCLFPLPLQYWDDPADAVRQQEGTLLPLWQFTTPRAKRRAVTALAWSPRYFDLFVVGYGSFDFLNPTTGLVACYSLKNPGHPEYCFSTAAGVMCLDFHPDHPNLLAVGCYDGRVCIFDVRAGGRTELGWGVARRGPLLSRWLGLESGSLLGPAHKHGRTAMGAVRNRLGKRTTEVHLPMLLAGLPTAFCYSVLPCASLHSSWVFQSSSRVNDLCHQPFPCIALLVLPSSRGRQTLVRVLPTQRQAQRSSVAGVLAEHRQPRAPAVQHLYRRPRHAVERQQERTELARPAGAAQPAGARW